MDHYSIEELFEDIDTAIVDAFAEDSLALHEADDDEGRVDLSQLFLNE